MVLKLCWWPSWPRSFNINETGEGRGWGKESLWPEQYRGRKRLLKTSSPYRKKTPNLSRICVLTYASTPRNTLEKLCSAHFRDGISLLHRYFLKKILIPAMLIPIWLLHPHLAPEPDWLCSFLYTTRPSEQWSSAAYIGRCTQPARIPFYIEILRWPFERLLVTPTSTTVQKGFALADSHGRSAASCPKQNMGHYPLKINFLFILQWCHPLGGNATAHSGAISTLSFTGSVQQQSPRTTYGTGAGLDPRSHPLVQVQNANSLLPWRGAPTKSQLPSCRPPEAPSCSFMAVPILGEKRCPPQNAPLRTPHRTSEPGAQRNCSPPPARGPA